jgi:predicted RNA-binding protein
MSGTSKRRYWIAVVSRSHVELGVAGGFAQVAHGKEQPLRRIHAGDWLVYYSPKTDMSAGAPLQAFTAIGEAIDDHIYQYRMADDFVPFRRDIAYRAGHEAAIQPLLDDLTFIKDKRKWGFPFRAGLIQIPERDFAVIAAAMGVEPRQTDAA